MAFSGGKAILGPQGTGVLCGRRDLVAAAALHNLDHDIYFEQWQAPPALFDKSALRGLPQHGIGRSCKVGKEQVVGLLAALERFDEAAVTSRHEASAALLETLIAALDPDLRAHCRMKPAQPGGEPRVRIAPPGFERKQAMKLVMDGGKRSSVGVSLTTSMPLRSGKVRGSARPATSTSTTAWVAPSAGRSRTARPWVSEK